MYNIQHQKKKKDTHLKQLKQLNKNSIQQWNKKKRYFIGYTAAIGIYVYI